MHLSLTPSQKAVIDSEANEILFASPIGGGKTTTLLAAASTGDNSIFGVHNQNAAQNIRRSAESMLGHSLGFSFHSREFVMKNIVPDTESRIGSKTIESFITNFSRQDDNMNVKFAGKGAKTLLIDEIYRLSEDKYTALISGHMSWSRDFQAKVIATTSPEKDTWFTKDDWVMKRWSAWFHPDPCRRAKMGELRYYVQYNDQEFEVGGPDQIEYLGLKLSPRSRTLIFAPLSENTWVDNLYQYRKALSVIPDIKWEQLMYGTFTTNNS